MAEPRIAKSLGRLREQVRAAVPDGPPLSEYGWIASEEHRRRSPNSDHNEDALGVVHALDIPHDPAHGLDTYELAAQLRDDGNAGKEPRLKYVISNRRIWNPAISKAWRTYNKEPHDQHVHVSVVGGALGDDARDWNLGDLGSKEPDVITRPLLKRGMSGEDVQRVQQALMVDSIFGPITEQAVRRFQALEELDDDGIVGPLTWRALQYRYSSLFPKEPSEDLPPAIEGWQTDITATVFGSQQTAYGDVIGDAEYGVALPFRFSGTRPIVQVWNFTANKAANAVVRDVGPWMVDDDYWQRNERPIAEICYNTKTPLPRGPNQGKVPSNPAGIDLTVAMAKALRIDGKGLVNWRIIT